MIGESKRIGYLCSEFPALSHTFISREISILEREGFKIVTASINTTRSLYKMDEQDKNYAKNTYYIKATPKLRIMALLLRYGLGTFRFIPALAYALRLNAFSGARNARKTIAYLIEAVLLHSWARKNGIRHIHVHFANPAATVALIATRFGNIEFSLSVHGPDEFYDVQQNVLREKIEEAVFVRCIGYYCQSQLMRLTPMSQWGKFHIVRCGLYHDEFSRRPARKVPGKTVLCVGRMCPSKGQAVLIEATRILRARGVDLQVVLLGGGEDLDAIRNMVKSKGLGTIVQVEGPVGHSRVKESLAECDLFVLPSFAEGIPVALMEAMASGVPVMSTNIMGIPELIEHGVSGLLVQPSNVEQLADAIEAVLLGKIDTGKFLDNAVEKIKTTYDVEANTRKLGELFRSIRRSF